MRLPTIRDKNYKFVKNLSQEEQFLKFEESKLEKAWLK